MYDELLVENPNLSKSNKGGVHTTGSSSSSSSSSSPSSSSSSINSSNSHGINIGSWAKSNVYSNNINSNSNSSSSSSSSSTGETVLYHTDSFLDRAGAIAKNVPNPIKFVETLNVLDDSKQSKDISPEAIIKRRKKMIRAIYGEFICTCIYFTCLFGAIANGHYNNWSEEFKVFTAAMVSGFMVVSFTLAFSDMSGANCNSAISFSLWLTGGLSNRKTVCYIIGRDVDDTGIFVFLNYWHCVVNSRIFLYLYL